MSCRCVDIGLDELFDAEFADKDARSYLKRGLPPRARRLLHLITQLRPLEGSTSLEGGSGAGALTVELARRGALQATGVDAMAAAVARADQLAKETNVASRATFQVADFAQLPDGLTADVIILDRVVCCYPEWTSLLRNAVGASNGLIALSYPAEKWWTRLSVWLMNLFQRMLGRTFRMHLHSPSSMHAYLRQHEFHIRSRDRYWLWELAVFVR